MHNEWNKKIPALMHTVYASGMMIAIDIFASWVIIRIKWKDITTNKNNSKHKYYDYYVPIEADGILL